LHRVGLKHLNQTAVILGVVVKGLVLVDNLAHCQLRLESSPKTISSLESPTWEATVYMYWLDTEININERFCDSAKQNENSIAFKFSCSTTVSGGVSVLSTSGIFFLFRESKLLQIDIFFSDSLILSCTHLLFGILQVLLKYFPTYTLFLIFSNKIS